MIVLIKSKDGHKKINLNRRKTIHEKCLNCSGWHPGDVAECTLKKCNLYPFRTGRGKQNSKDRSKAIKAHCLWCMNDQVGEITKCPSSDCALFAFRKRCYIKAIKLSANMVAVCGLSCARSSRKHLARRP
jgi:hypothetical protein